MIQKSSIDKVIDRADIVEVIGQFINLKKRGSNFLALCPFHNEKTPSFNVNPVRGIYKCFGCGKAGDTVSFVEEYEKFSFPEAIRWLADFYQIELEETETTEDFKHLHQTEESLRLINEFAADYFHKILTDNETGRIVGKGYFTERGFRDETIDEFRLGYCLDEWDAFTQAALKAGYNKELLEKTGLVKIKTDKIFDNYKGRVIFPITGNTGKVLGFGARVLKKSERAPKYINTPENELYVKNKILYGLYQARQAIRKADECFLVEGYTDVISLHQGGIKNVVASSGTSLTDGQLKLISSLSKNLTILYDGDAAGIKAALRGLDMALERSFRVRLVLLPDGEDPDSFMKASGGANFKDYIEEHRQDVINFHLEIGLKEAGNDPIKKSNLVSEIAETISRLDRIENFSLQDDYIRESAKKLNVDEGKLIFLVNKYTRERKEREQRQQQRTENSSSPEDSTQNNVSEESIAEPNNDLDVAALLSQEHKEEWQLLKMLLLYGSRPFRETTVAGYFHENVDLNIIQDATAQKMMQLYDDYFREHEEPPTDAFFLKHTDANIRHRVVDLVYEKEAPDAAWQDRFQISVPSGEAIYKEDVASTFAFFELRYIRRLLDENSRELKESTDAARNKALMQTHRDLKRREKELLTAVIVK